MKKIIKITIFLIIFCIIFYSIFEKMWLAPNSISCIYSEPKNSLDVIYIGASNTYAHFNSVLAYNLYGYTTGLVSADAQSFIFAKYLIKESEKYQKPYVYVIDLAQVATNMEDFGDGEIRTTTDVMKFSKNRIDAINDILKYKKDINKEDYINYYFSFLMYHNKWREFNKNNVNINLYKGYLFSDMTIKTEEQEAYTWNENILELQDANKKILLDLINYIKNNNINVIFVVPKRYFIEQNNMEINDAIRIIEENNLKVINCNTIEELNNINFETDLYNYAHINVYGATKYTLWFSKYLKEKYNLPNHKEDLNYLSWNIEYDRFKESFNSKTSKNFDDLLLKYSEK